MRTKPLDTLLGFKALSLAGGLTENDRRVGATLLEHFNRKTGRCDPSIGRIARLLGITIRTVNRSIRHLEDASLARRYRHGGYLNRNQYEPNWLKLAELEAAWNARFKGYRPPSAQSLEQGQPCHSGSDSSVTQTCSKNLPNETCSASRPNWNNGPTSSSNLSLPTTALTMKSSIAARSAAERRWNDQLLRRFASQPAIYGDMVERIDSAMQERATDAELAHRGDGFTYIVEALGMCTGRSKQRTAGCDGTR